jgi:hypothetical protein
MKIRTIALTVATCVIGLTLCYAESPLIGTWKLNDAKSKFSPGASKSVTVVYTAAGDSLKCTIDGVDGDGKPTHTEWTGKPDGKDYPVTGDSGSDARSLKMVNEHSYKVAAKQGGKVLYSGELVVAADGKSRTVTLHGTGADGKKMASTAVYDKQ